MKLIDSLRQAGRLEAEGAFTLDLEKARDKMARFGLTDPERYILELVAAAFAGGAESLDVRLTEAGLELTFEGTPLQPADLESLDDFLLVAEGTNPALRYLAVGLNALSRLKPRLIRLETPAGSALQLEGKKRRLESGRFARHRLLIDRGGQLFRKATYQSELALIESEASYSSRPVRVDGWDIRSGSRHEVVLVENAQLSDVCFVLHGVVRGRDRSPFLPCLAALEDDRFALNASHSGVVQDETYRAALGRLREASMEALEQLCSRCQEDAERLERYRPFLLSLGGLEGQGGWREALDEVPMFSGPHRLRSSFRELEAQRKRLRFVPTTTMRMTFEPVGLSIVYLGEGSLERSFLEARGVATQDAGPALLEQITARNNRARWEESPRPRALPSDDYAVTYTGEHRGVFVSVGLPWRASTSSLLHVLYQGKLLTTQTLDNKLSYTAVLDFPELEVSSDWTGPEEKDAGYRAARKEVESQALLLYEELARRNDPRAYDQLMVSLLRQGAQSPAAGLDLLPTLLGGRISLQAALKAPLLGYVPTTRALPSENIPAQAYPEMPVVRATEQVLELLRKAAGKRLQNASEQLDHLLDLGRRLASRRDARLVGAPGHAFTGDDGLAGELRLRPANNAPSTVILLRKGVELETRNLQAVAWAYDAILDNPRFNPTRDWRRVESDRAWQEAVDALRRAEQYAFVKLVTRLAVVDTVPGWEDAVLAGLESFPELATRAASLALFPSRGGSERVSLAQLEAEHAQSGYLSYTDRTGPTAARVLYKPNRQLLELLIPGVRFRPYAAPPPLVGAPKVQAPVVVKVVPAVLEGAFAARRTLPFGAVGLTDSLDGGVLEVAGYGPVRPSPLPRAVRAVMTAEGLSFTQKGALARDDVFSERLATIRQAASEMAVEASAQAAAGSDRCWMLLSLLATNMLSDEARDKLEVLPLVPMHCAPPLSLKELCTRLHKRDGIPVIEPGFPFAALNDRPVVSATTEQTRLLSSLFSKPCRSDRDELLRDETRRENGRKLAGRKVRLPACLVEDEVEGETLSGKVGLPAQQHQACLLCLDDDRVVGEVNDRGLAGFVRGTFRLSHLHDRIELSRQQIKELKEFSVQLLGKLAEQYAERPSKAGRQRLLEFLVSNKRELASGSPAGQVVEKILDLALFPAAGGRMTSPRAMLEEAGRGGLTYLERPGVPGPDSGVLPVLRPRSLEWEAARALVGERRLQLEDRPTLVERGLSWLDSGWNRVFTALDKKATALVAAGDGGDAGKPAPARKAPQVVPRDSPEDLLVRSLRREFNLICPRELRGPWMQLVEDLKCNHWWDAWLLSSAVIFQNGHPVLNWTHPAVRYARDHHRRDPGCLTLLAAHLFCELNRDRPEITDEHEMIFLTALASTLRSSYENREADA